MTTAPPSARDDDLHELGDGRRVLSVTVDGKLQDWDRVTGVLLGERSLPVGPRLARAGTAVAFAPGGERVDLFGAGGGDRLAAELRVPLLGQIPLQPGIADAADHGTPALIAVPDSPAAKALRAIAEKVASGVAPTAAISLTN